MSFAVKIPTSTAGGEYQIVIKSSLSAFLPSKRKIYIEKYEQPDYLVTVDFEKQGGYLPGEAAKAKIKIRRPDGEQLLPGSKAKVECQTIGLSLDLDLDNKGETTVEFLIPQTVTAKSLSFSVSVLNGFSA